MTSMRFANEQNILCQGRSSAQVQCCFLPQRDGRGPHREQPLALSSRERGRPPDIDVDFEHQRREEVIRRLPPPAMTAPPLPPLSSASPHRSAVRDVGKPWAL
jgi:error-prone DNA polymerase